VRSCPDRADHAGAGGYDKYSSHDTGKPDMKLLVNLIAEPNFRHIFFNPNPV
jgi:hypothetical protein